MSKNGKSIKLEREDIEVKNGKMVITNPEFLDAVQSENGLSLDDPDGQNAISVTIKIG